jgi:hypothetical protein
LLFRGETADGAGLVLADVDHLGSARLVAADGDDVLRPNGWTPDGRRIVYTLRNPEVDSTGPARIRVLDLTTEAFVDIDAGYADVSNDGTRLLAVDPDGRPCVASIDGGPCVAIADAALGYDGTFSGGTFWAPNDESIVASTDRGLEILDPAGGEAGRPPSWLTDGAESWQRLAR